MFPAIEQEIKTAPWLKPLWSSLDFDRFPNAILIHGQSGIGKFAFAVELAKALLCESTSPTGKPCNQCDGCHWFNTGNHPDFLALVPETHRKLLPQSSLEIDEEPKRGKATRDDLDGEGSEKKEKKTAHEKGESKAEEKAEHAKELDEARFEKGEDIGKPGKGFAKVAKAAAKQYGSKEAGQKVAGAILKKVVAKGK